MAEGMIGVFCSRYFHRGKWDNGMLFLLTAVTEVCQMLLILLIARPFSSALEVVKEIALPMIILNSCGMVVFIGTFRALSMEKNQRYQLGAACGKQMPAAPPQRAGQSRGYKGGGGYYLPVHHLFGCHDYQPGTYPGFFLPFRKQGLYFGGKPYEFPYKNCHGAE